MQIILHLFLGALKSSLKTRLFLKGIFYLYLAFDFFRTLKSLVSKSTNDFRPRTFLFCIDGERGKRMIEKMYWLAGAIVVSEISLAISLFWAIEAHLV
jgi:hypothetical protein